MTTATLYWVCCACPNWVGLEDELKKIRTDFGPAQVCPRCDSEDVFPCRIYVCPACKKPGTQLRIFKECSADEPVGFEEGECQNPACSYRGRGFMLREKVTREEVEHFYQS